MRFSWIFSDFCKSEIISWIKPINKICLWKIGFENYYIVINKCGPLIFSSTHNCIIKNKAEFFWNQTLKFLSPSPGRKYLILMYSTERFDIFFLIIVCFVAELADFNHWPCCYLSDFHIIVPIQTGKKKWKKKLL